MIYITAGTVLEKWQKVSVSRNTVNVCVIMTKKINIVTEISEVKKSAIDYALISKAMMLWGTATALQGVIIVYTMSMQLITNINAGLVNPISFIALPYELNAIAGIFNLFFGIALIALGQKVKKW